MAANTITLKWKKLTDNAQIPQMQTPGSACFDMVATEDVTVRKGQVTAIPTGLSVEIPTGFEMQLRARSGLAFRHGFTLVNGIGTIDSDYRGELKVLATLLADNELQVKKGDRICQALVAPVLVVQHVEGVDLSDSERGSGGFGSTGVSSQNA